jgi:hypothetical protein
MGYPDRLDTSPSCDDGGSERLRIGRASHGSGDAGGVRFNFPNGDRAVRGLEISVYELERGHRGRTVCELRRLAGTDDVAQSFGWRTTVVSSTSARLSS